MVVNNYGCQTVSYVTVANYYTANAIHYHIRVYCVLLQLNLTSMKNKNNSFIENRNVKNTSAFLIPVTMKKL